MLPPDADAEEWSRTLRALWADQTKYDAYSQAAHEGAIRKELEAEFQLSQHEAILRQAADTGVSL